MAATAGCAYLVAAGEFTISSSAAAARSSSSAKASSSRAVISATSASRSAVSRRRNAGLELRTSSLCGLHLSAASRGGAVKRSGVCGARAYQSSSSVVGQDPDWEEDDFVVVGLAHCFKKDDNQKLIDSFVIEPIPAGGLECMDNGGQTCYLHAVRTTLGAALRMDASVFPKQFEAAAFCEKFEFRTKCASRTWKRDHAQEHLIGLLPKDGSVRSDWNFSLQDKRILNQEHVVNDSDNIKQDMSIDVYGRTEKEEEMTAEIGQLYNV